MQRLAGLNILLVESPSFALAGVEQALSVAGASVMRFGVDELVKAAAYKSRVHVIIADDRGQPSAAAELARQRGGLDGLSVQPMIAIHSLRTVGDSAFIKTLRGPTNDADVVQAVASLAPPAVAQPARTSQAPFNLMASFERFIDDGNLRGALAMLNVTSTFRFTSIFRFDGEALTSVWSYDRQAPQSDGFPLNVTVDASYCSLVRDAQAPFAVEDARTDARVAQHPKRFELLSYMGVPLKREDGSMYGTLCHFDVEARVVGNAVLPWLEQAAALLAKKLP